MTGFLKVDTDALDRLADQIRRAAAEARTVGLDPEPLRSSIHALRAPDLVQATSAFVEAWGPFLAGLVMDAGRLADAIALVSRSYRDAEQDAESVSSRGLPR